MVFCAVSDVTTKATKLTFCSQVWLCESFKLTGTRVGFEKRAHGGSRKQIESRLDSDLRDLTALRDGERLLEGESVRSSREEVEVERWCRLEG